MEIEDLAYPLVAGVTATDDPAVAFKDADIAIFLGAFPRKEGMERKDVMEKNVGIFNSQGSAIQNYAKPTVKCLVVGNPANTNAAILSSAAPAVPKTSISALTRLDHNRATSLAAARMGVPCDELDCAVFATARTIDKVPSGATLVRAATESVADGAKSFVLVVTAEQEASGYLYDGSVPFTHAGKSYRPPPRGVWFEVAGKGYAVHAFGSAKGMTHRMRMSPLRCEASASPRHISRRTSSRCLS